MIAAKGCILSVICAVMISSILQKILSGGTSQKWISLFCKVYISVILVSHLLTVDFQGIPDVIAGKESVSRSYAMEGQQIAHTQIRDIIKHNVQAYILSKAEQLELSVAVTVSLSSDEIPYPDKVTLKGKIPPYKKTLLSNILTDDLGISREDQIWIG